VFKPWRLALGAMVGVLIEAAALEGVDVLLTLEEDEDHGTDSFHAFDLLTALPVHCQWALGILVWGALPWALFRRCGLSAWYWAAASGFIGTLIQLAFTVLRSGANVAMLAPFSAVLGVVSAIAWGAAHLVAVGRRQRR